MIENQDFDWDLVAGKLHRELESEEELTFDQKMADPAFRVAFDRAQQLKDELVRHGIALSERKELSWKNIERGIQYDRLRWIKWVAKYAAVVVLAFIGGVLYHYYTQQKAPVHFSELYVPYGQMSQLTLSDGTVVWLNSGTTLRYPDRFSDETRSVYIAGEAYFQVAKMADKPFLVSSPDLRIKVLGTSFNFSAYKEDPYSSVTLVEGNVAVQDSSGKTIARLHEGQMATKDKKASTFLIKGEKTEFYTAWIEGKIVFDDERMDQIAIKLERWFNVKINFADPQLKARRFTGTILKNKPLDQIMQALELLSPIRYEHQIHANGKDQITIYKKS